GETINETFQGGFFHALNPWSIPDWAFIGILVITVVGFVVGAEKFGKMLEVGGKTTRPEKSQGSETLDI
ncbi:hypothetical protein, partial [Glutamicibacter ardleyensis]|uniref:hypothetical protein n=1 Tax=Glutamicibacter ardleyensis TaxID=225894 RepID=UPI003F8E46C9